MGQGFGWGHGGLFFWCVWMEIVVSWMPEADMKDGAEVGRNLGEDACVDMR